MAEIDGVTRRGLRVLRRFIRTHPGPFGVSVGGAVLGAAAMVGSTIVVGRVTDRVVRPAFEDGVSTGTVVGGAVVIVLFGFLRAGGVMVRRYAAGMMEARMQVSLRKSVVDHYLDVPMAFHRSRPTGELLAHADADVVGSTMVIKPLPFSIGVVALVVFALASLVVVDLWFAAIAMVLFPALTLLNRFYTRRVEGPSTRVQEAVGEVSSIAHESFDGALVVKALGRQHAEVERLAAAADRLRTQRVAVGRLRSLFEPLMDALPTLATIVLLVVAAWRVDAGAATEGEVIQAVLLFSILAFPMRVVGFLLEELPRAVVSMDRIDRVLDVAVSPLPSDGDRRVLPNGALSVSFDDVRFSHGEAAVLAGLTFEVRAGESVALVGATGSGKSTVNDLLVRLVEPDSGTIRVGGVDIASIIPDELRQAVALVFQEAFLFAASVSENLRLDADIPDDEVEHAASLARAHAFIRHLPEGYDTVLGERGVTLSGGQRQRVALARALLRRPRVLLLDDATSAVDPLVEAQILEGLRRSESTTLLIVAHRLSTIRLAQRVLFIEGGRVAASGTHEQLLADPGYAALVRAYEEREHEGGDENVDGLDGFGPVVTGTATEGAA